MGHLTKWLFFNLMFGAIPYTLVVALNQLQSPGSPLLHPSSEVLFIAVVATSSALGELWDGEDPGLPRRSRGRALSQLVLLLGVLITSILYGAYVYHTLISPGRAFGIDCAAVAELSSRHRVPDAGVALAGWEPVCGRWARVNTGFFQWSLWVTGFGVIASTSAMHFFRPRRRW
ncbi:MAG TPA: hypothetical protein VK358_09875 [Longimicrobium sp.]|nr:hypothetical protein [Longimicrobium sp.]